MQKFIKTKEIIEIENKIEVLKKELILKKEKLWDLLQKEFDKQHGLIIGKSIIKLTYKEEKYVYAGLRKNIYPLWPEGHMIIKSKIWKRKRCLFDDWEITGEVL